jgi:hypothetical protein
MDVERPFTGKAADGVEDAMLRIVAIAAAPAEGSPFASRDGP